MRSVGARPVAVAVRAGAGRGSAEPPPPVRGRRARATAAVALQAELSDRLEAERFYQPEKRPFWPHVTVARVKPAKRSDSDRRGRRRGRPMRVETPARAAAGGALRALRRRPDDPLPFAPAAHGRGVRAPGRARFAVRRELDLDVRRQAEKGAKTMADEKKTPRAPRAPPRTAPTPRRRRPRTRPCRPR